jgi:hypothetical protein
LLQHQDAAIPDFIPGDLESFYHWNGHVSAPGLVGFGCFSRYFRENIAAMPRARNKIALGNV